jgi:hypothetical protein
VDRRDGPGYRAGERKPEQERAFTKARTVRHEVLPGNMGASPLAGRRAGILA